MADTTLVLLQDAAMKLGSLSGEVVFVGGATLGLHITDQGAAPIRPTTDIDVIAEIATYADYIAFSELLRQKGFEEDHSEGAPVCRWRNGELILDVMPISASVLGFSNRWYRDAMKTAEAHQLPNGTSIRVISSPYFLGTKIEAFCNRGNRDYWSSRDLEDYIAVIDGRESILKEIASSAPDLRGYLSNATRDLRSEEQFLHVLPGYLLPDEGNQLRLEALIGKLKAISQQ